MNLTYWAIVALAPTLVLAQGPFDGTWKTMVDQSKLSDKLTVVSLKDGIYENQTTVPKIHVKADGQDHEVVGQQYNTLAVKEIDARTINLIQKKDGKLIGEMTQTVSHDGKTLVSRFTRHPSNGADYATEFTFARVETASPGSHSISGSWRVQQAKASDKATLNTYKTTGEGISCSLGTGSFSWTARFDGKDYPLTGDTRFESVSLEKMDEHTIETKWKKDGKVVHTDWLIVSEDGKKLTTLCEDRETGRVNKWVAEKQ